MDWIVCANVAALYHASVVFMRDKLVRAHKCSLRTSSTSSCERKPSPTTDPLFSHQVEASERVLIRSSRPSVQRDDGIARKKRP